MQINYRRTAGCVLLTLLLISSVFSTPAQAAGKKSPKGHGWKVLFDGTSAKEWRGYQKADFPKSWKVEKGALKTIPGDGQDIVSLQEYADFELELEWKISPGGNSGIMYHVTEEYPAPWHTGPEYQVLDDDKHADGKNPKTSAGALYALIEPAGKKLQPVGQWNKTRIIVKGSHAEHWLNGVKVVEYELGSDSLKKLIAGSKFAPMPKFGKQPTGHIVLQHHHDEVWYRKIRIRRL